MRRILLIIVILGLAACTGGTAPVVETTEVRGEKPGVALPSTILVELDYERFQLLFDCERGEVHRFTYRLDRDNGTLDRHDNYQIDRSLPEGCKGQHSTIPYSQIDDRFDRGHLVPVNHFDDSRQAMNAANLMSNLVPQYKPHNTGVWKRTENLTECYREPAQLTVIGGVVYGDSEADANNDYFVESHGVRTPEFFWRVLYTTDPLTGEAMAIAWWIPHFNYKGDHLNEYVVSIREVEQLLGPNEPIINVPNELKDSKPAESWRAPADCARG
jgi:endonuclease G